MPKQLQRFPGLQKEVCAAYHSMQLVAFQFGELGYSEMSETIAKSSQLKHH
jgi:hypothetical protein